MKNIYKIVSIFYVWCALGSVWGASKDSESLAIGTSCGSEAIFSRVGQTVRERAWVDQTYQVRILYLPKSGERYSAAYNVRDWTVYTGYHVAREYCVLQQKMKESLRDYFLRGCGLKKGSERPPIRDPQFGWRDAQREHYTLGSFYASPLYFLLVDILADHPQRLQKFHTREEWLALDSTVLKKIPVGFMHARWSLISFEGLQKEVDVPDRKTSKIFIVVQGEGILKATLAKKGQDHATTVDFGDSLFVRKLHEAHLLFRPTNFDWQWMREGCQVRVMYFPHSREKYSASFNVTSWNYAICDTLGGRNINVAVPLLECIANQLFLGYQLKDGCSHPSTLLHNFRLSDIDQSRYERCEFYSSILADLIQNVFPKLLRKKSCVQYHENWPRLLSSQLEGVTPRLQSWRWSTVCCENIEKIMLHKRRQNDCKIVIIVQDAGALVGRLCWNIFSSESYVGKASLFYKKMESDSITKPIRGIMEKELPTCVNLS